MPVWTNNQSVRTPLLLLMGFELLAVYCSVIAASSGIIGGVPLIDNEFENTQVVAVVVAVILVTSLIGMGLYNIRQRLYFREILARVLVGVTLGALAIAVMFFLFPSLALPRTHVTLAILTSVVLILAIRTFFFHSVDAHVFRRRTLVYGAGERAKSISDLRRRADRRGFIVVGSVPASGDRGVHTEGNLIEDQSLTEIVKQSSIDEIVIAMDDRRGNLPIRELIDCKLSGVNVIDVVEFLERESEKVRIDLVNPSNVIFSPGFRVSRLSEFGKRLFDLVVGAIALLLVWPLFVLVAIAIKCEDGLRAPVFYHQERVGQFGALFPILKFRSMIQDAETSSGAVWAEKNDARVTKVGRLIRKIRLDELPQLLNVLRGEMSLVGPRPERPMFVEELAETIPYYKERHTVRPGITGWAQLCYSYGSSEEDAVQKLQYDLYYVKNQSLILDLTILLRTVEVIIWGIGSR